jgi:hypothetical protein
VLFAEIGFDVNARGRTDIPMEQRWETALHEAAGQGNLHWRVSCSIWAPTRTSKDAHFDATPWPDSSNR